MKWQKRARLGIAIFGIACAIVVYAAIGERQSAAPPEPPARLDPRAILESEGAQVQQERGAERDFDIQSERQLAYEDGSSKLIGVVIRVRGRGGRDYVLRGEQAQAGENQRELQLSGAVRLEASDGFQLQAERGSFNRDDGMIRVPGEVTFSRGRMSGAGVGMSYDETHDVITIADSARVTMNGEDGNVAYSFTAGAAILNRAEDVLTLDGDVQGTRGEQVFQGDRALARLTADDDAVTFIELRGNAAVSGGDSTLDSMSARDIDLDYTDDGTVLERVLLSGGGAVALKGENGAAGRQILGDTLDLTLAPDGAVTRAVGRDNVRLDLPASEGIAARSVRAAALDAAGEPGRGLTDARFTGSVEYEEQPGTRGGAPRTAASRALRVAMDGNAIRAAVFTGSARFEEQGLRASAAAARYEPEAGTLRLSGTDAGGPPRVADEQVTIEAQTAIDVTLADRHMTAKGGVMTTLRAARGSKLPGLLDNDQPANVKADTLAYHGEAGRAVYTGDAEMWQGQTAIRANAITIDQKSGDLLAAGRARAVIALDGGNSIATAADMRYDDAKRVLSLVSHLPPPGGRAAPPVPTPAAPARGGAAAGARGTPATPGRGPAVPPPPAQAQLVGPQGTIQANRIDLALARDGSRLDRLEAGVHVTARVDTRVATGAHLTYFAADERYVMTGATAVPVRVVDACRETTGKTLTFFKSADRIIVDGNEEIRTQTRSGGPCAATPAAR